jgi:molybdopterin-biosynthesis enzyme MoeA-like protein
MTEMEAFLLNYVPLGKLPFLNLFPLARSYHRCGHCRLLLVTQMSERIYTAAVVIIGNEILSGRTQDTNLRDIAVTVGGWGLRVTEARVVPDVEATIVSVVNEVRARHDYVFTTGGIGPTHDDITAACIAKAFGVALVEHPEIAAIIRKREAPPEVMTARLRMALVPEGSGLIDNVTGGPPGFFIGNVYVMAGIPTVMRAMLGSLATKLKGGAVVQSRSITAYVAESAIAARLRSIQDQHTDIDIGSYPFSREGKFGTTLVARGTSESPLQETVDEIKAMIVALGETPIE